jgi:hypothetical protein
MAAAAAEIFINCLRQQRRRLRTVWVSAAAARKSFKIFSHRRRRLDVFRENRRRRRRLSRSAYTSSWLASNINPHLL